MKHKNGCLPPYITTITITPGHQYKTCKGCGVTEEVASLRDIDDSLGPMAKARHARKKLAEAGKE